MAKPIEFRPKPQAESQGSREKTMQRLHEAPVQHADAMLAAYDLLQEMHDSGILDLLRGALGAGNKIVGEASEALAQPETIRGIRNLLLLAKALSSIRPEVLERMVSALPGVEEQLPEEKPPSMLSLLRRTFSAEVRRGLGVGLTAAAALGRAVGSQPR